MKKFSKEILYDEDAYYMSSPEFVVEYLANLIKNYKVAVEVCSAIGIAVCVLAKKMDKVYGVEINPKRVEMAKYNANLYGVSGKVEFILGDALDNNLLKQIKASVAILDPDWSVDKKNPKIHSSSLSGTTPNAVELFNKVKSNITSNIVLRVSKNVSIEDLKELGVCHVHNIYYGGKIRFKYAFYLDTIKENKEISKDFGDK